jgi:cell division protein FtsQ
VKRPQRYTPPATSKPAGQKPPRPKSAAPKSAAEKSASPKAKIRSERAELRAASAGRRKYEKQEVKRFTRHARVRRGVVAAVLASIAVLAVVISVAVFSPALALRTITVTGASRLDPSVVSAALSGQLGKPLALVDYDAITHELSKFPLIRSYTTQSAPPHTLVVAIVERVPIGVVMSGTAFHLVDPAGVTVESTAERAVGLPLIDLGTASIKDPAYRSVVRVLLSLPPDLLARVDTITATTNDDVTFVLVGGGQSVVWGSSDRSAYKARVLAALISTQNPAAQLEYDVSAPDSVVVRPK